MDVLKKLWLHPFTQFLGSLALIYVGLGFLGIVPGFTGTSWFSRILGAGWVLSGVVALYVPFARRKS